MDFLDLIEVVTVKTDVTEQDSDAFSTGRE